MTTGSAEPTMAGLSLRRAGSEDVTTAQAAYRHIIAHLSDTVDYPHWHSEGHPPPDLIRDWVLAGELYLVVAPSSAETPSDAQETAGVMVLNHDAAAGYRTAAWGVDAAPDHVLVVHALGVTPGFQRRGVARFLVEAAIRIARETGCLAVRLDTYVENVPARRLYERCGFTDLGVHTIHYDGAAVDQFHLFEFVL